MNLTRKKRFLLQGNNTIKKYCFVMYNETMSRPAQAVGQDVSHHPTFGEVGLFCVNDSPADLTSVSQHSHSSYDRGP